MTLSAEPNAEDKDIRKPDDESGKADPKGTSLERAQTGSLDESDLGPFLAAAGERIEVPPSEPRPLYSKFLDYSAHAAMIVGLLGFAWTISDHVAKREPDPAPVKVVAAPATPPVDEAAELRRNTQKMAADISALRLSLESLRTTMRQDKTTEQIKALSANLDGVKSGLTATKTETNAALSQLSGKIDHLPHSETNAKMQQIVDRLDKMERQNADTMTTASIAPPAKVTPIAVPPVKPQAAKLPEPDSIKPDSIKKASAEPEPPKKPDVIAGWVVRDVYDGIAVVESKHGPMEVTPGTTIPGAGVVKSIDRHGNSWTVTTSKGQIAYVPPPRDHGPRDYYRSVPDDF